MAAFQNTTWRLISGILVVTCLVLMTTLGIMLKNALTKESTQPTPSPGITTEAQEGSGCCSCKEKWIGYQCNCYFVSNEQKSWAESRSFCASQNSSLLQWQKRDELNFIKTSKRYYWIGLSYRESHRAWLWEDGSAFSKDEFKLFGNLSTEKCVLYNIPERLMDESCEKENYYICKQQRI